MVTRDTQSARSAVYNTQVKTATVGLSVVPCQWHLIRRVRAYRTPESLAARSRLAQEVRAMRRNGTPFGPPPQFGIRTAHPDGINLA